MFTNNASLVHDSIIVPVLQSTTHHSLIRILTSYKVKYVSESHIGPSSKKMFDTLNFHSDKIDWSMLSDRLNTIEWSQILNGLDTTKMLNLFYDRVYKVCCDHVPLKKDDNTKKNSKIVRYRRSLIKRRRNISMTRQKSSKKTTEERKLMFQTTRGDENAQIENHIYC